MLAWLTANLGTIAVTLLLIAAVFGIIRSLIRDRKHGKSSYGGSCAHCGMCAACRQKQ